MKVFGVIALIAIVIFAGFHLWNYGKSQAVKPAEQTAREAVQIDLQKTEILNFPPPDDFRFYGLCYGPFSGNENPACGPYPTEAEIVPQIKEMKKWTKRIRIYSALGSIAEIIVKTAKAEGMEVLVGAWLGKEKFANEAEIAGLIYLANKYHLEQVVVGNEVLLFNHLSESELIGYIKQVKQATKAQVSTAEIGSLWLEHPALANACDFLVMHCYGFWDNIPYDKSAGYAIAKYKEVKRRYSPKPVILGETGWPKIFSKNNLPIPPGTENDQQKRFLTEFCKLAAKEDIPYYYFEAFDEPWKALVEKGVGDKWGVWFMKREEGNHPQIITKFPFVVYDEPANVSNFIPSGWMGDIEAVRFNPDHRINPHNGKSCIEIRFDGVNYGKNWAGIYWQYPENNWGQLPGYQFKGVVKLTFWARGQYGGETSVFKVGGIDSGFIYKDSMPLTKTADIKLTKNWQRYEIPIKNPNQLSVISGFCWVTPFRHSTVIIYLDDIRFE